MTPEILTMGSFQLRFEKEFMERLDKDAAESKMSTEEWIQFIIEKWYGVWRPHD